MQTTVLSVFLSFYFADQSRLVVDSSDGGQFSYQFESVFIAFDELDHVDFDFLKGKLIVDEYRVSF